ncbi:PH domain-containing protein [Persicobacter psychrovividus]|uniref:Uncharacterized protein YyaB-like PH domain-containing protein n=1 Tax=Persicobacter psychrovividus TaxID=387638 RepID=A0ABM7VFX1_9BACT|nr:hypothetical protein PEPS_18520 [Persicobacter psychrovividus]
MQFRSKIDWWFFGPIFLLLFGISFLGGTNDGAFWVVFSIDMATILFVLYVLLSTKYWLDEQQLIVTCGILMRKEISIDKIQSIKKTYNMMSSPACSFDRIEVKYGKYEGVIISPKNRKAFIDEILRVNPKVEVHESLNMS